MQSLSDLSDTFIRYGERSFARAVEFMQKLAEVRDVYHATKLQTEFVQAQVKAIYDLINALGRPADTAITAVAEAPAPKTVQPKAAPPPTVTLKQIARTLAERHGTAKKQMDKLLGASVIMMAEHLKQGDRVRIAGLGTFQVRNRAARLGRNPTTGEEIAIAASRTVTFRAAKEVNAAISEETE